MAIYTQAPDADYKYRKHENFICRKCGSLNITKNGKNRYGSQQYYCKDCRAYYAQASDADSQYRKRENFICRECGSLNIKKNGKNRYGSQQYYCNDCHVYYTQAPDADSQYRKHGNFICRECGSLNIKKNGKNRYGSQQYYCNDCHASGVLEPKGRYTEERKSEILKAYRKLPNMSKIERILGVSRQTLSKWIKKYRVSSSY